MMSDDPTSPGRLAHRAIGSRADFRSALLDAFDAVAQAQAREVVLCDADFAAWPLGERETVDRLDAWAGAGRRLVLFGRRFDELARRHPRWIAWRVTWSHLVVCRTQTETVIDPWPTFLLAPGVVSVRLIDREHHRGWLSSEPRDLASCRDQFDALSQRSVEAFPPTTLGI